MRRKSLLSLAGFVLLCAFGAREGRTQTPAATCPVQAVHFNPSGLDVRMENTSGKTIVGMSWFAAIPDGRSTDHACQVPSLENNKKSLRRLEELPRM